MNEEIALENIFEQMNIYKFQIYEFYMQPKIYSIFYSRLMGTDPFLIFSEEYI